MGMESKVRTHVHKVNQVHTSRCYYNTKVDVKPLFAEKETGLLGLTRPMLGKLYIRAYLMPKL